MANGLEALAIEAHRFASYQAKAGALEDALRELRTVRTLEGLEIVVSTIQSSHDAAAAARDKSSPRDGVPCLGSALRAIRSAPQAPLPAVDRCLFAQGLTAAECQQLEVLFPRLRARSIGFDLPAGLAGMRCPVMIWANSDPVNIGPQLARAMENPWVRHFRRGDGLDVLQCLLNPEWGEAWGAEGEG